MFFSQTALYQLKKNEIKYSKLEHSSFKAYKYKKKIPSKGKRNTISAK